nr:hypothetical protein [Citrobacter freundii]
MDAADIVRQAIHLLVRVVHFKEDDNVLTLLTDTLDVVRELAETAASHTHPNTGASGQAAQFTATATKTGTLKSKYGPLIA